MCREMRGCIGICVGKSFGVIVRPEKPIMENQMEKSMGYEMETEARLVLLGIGCRNLNAWNGF